MGEIDGGAAPVAHHADHFAGLELLEGAGLGEGFEILEADRARHGQHVERVPGRSVDPLEMRGDQLLQRTGVGK